MLLILRPDLLSWPALVVPLRHDTTVGIITDERRRWSYTVLYCSTVLLSFCSVGGSFHSLPGYRTLIAQKAKIASLNMKIIIKKKENENRSLKRSARLGTWVSEWVCVRTRRTRTSLPSLFSLCVWLPIKSAEKPVQNYYRIPPDYQPDLPHHQPSCTHTHTHTCGHFHIKKKKVKV